MEITPTNIGGLVLIKPKVFEDARGYFFEKFREDLFRKAGLAHHFVQDNQSRSARGVIRGLHYQLAPFAQTKLVHVLQGEIWDVALDLRRGSPGFGKWYGAILSESNKLQMYIPRGFAHGFSVLSDTAVVEYKCDQVYHPESERGILFSDPELAIDWKTDLKQASVSARDTRLPVFSEAEMNFLG